MGEDHPARPAAQRGAGSLEFRLPLLVAAPVLFDGCQRFTTSLTVAAEIGEIMLVQHDRAGAYQLFAFEVAVNVRGQVLSLSIAASRCSTALSALTAPL